MIDHLGFPVSDIARATEFYLKALAPLGYGLVMEVSAAETGHGAAVGFGAPGEDADFQSGKPSFWISEGERSSGPVHVAFVVPSRAAVDAFYRAALDAGGKEYGPPGLRPHYYAAFVLDPDGQQHRGGVPRYKRSGSEAIAHQ